MFYFVFFMDFDGVTHPGTSGTMRYVARFEALLKKYPKAMVVISSNWKMSESLESLRGWFSPEFASRIIDVTPNLPENGAGSRQAEIEAWLSKHPTRFWRAMDDDRTLFRQNCNWVILTDKKYGVTDKELALLEEALIAAGA